MVNNTKLLISSALISSFLIGNIASATNEDSDIVGGHVAVKQALDSQNWNEIEEGLSKAADVNAFLKSEQTNEEAWKKAGGVGTKLPGSDGSYAQKAGRAVVNAAKIGWDIAEPFVFAAGARVAGDFVLSYVGPLVVEEAGNAAAAIASAANTWWTQYIPAADQYIRSGASRVAQGEALRDLGFLTDTVQTYAVPVAKTVYKATKTAAETSYACVKAIGSAASSAYSWGMSWFASEPTAKAAEAA
ncbi:MAG: hypothetical protein BGO67_08940 [Alphaproteobacteria bacterium 41-28]|nr:MAG: hypothetical protein BGO67_08940 [Alphaproteobacteria bacterium 41-28]